MDKFERLEELLDEHCPYDELVQKQIEELKSYPLDDIFYLASENEMIPEGFTVEDFIKICRLVALSQTITDAEHDEIRL